MGTAGRGTAPLRDPKCRWRTSRRRLYGIDLEAQGGDSLTDRLCSTSLSTCCARLADRWVPLDSTLPSMMLAPEHRPSQEQKRLAVAKRLTSGPTPLSNFIITVTLSALMCVRPTPAQAANRTRHAGLRMQQRGIRLAGVERAVGYSRRIDDKGLICSVAGR
jgi:hypothetical protein